MKLLIASDHAGLPLKEFLKTHRPDIDWLDLGPHDAASVDYPDYADLVAMNIKSDEKGLLICGSGQGMCMRANKYPNVRAALCWDTVSVKLAREHNDANILCMGARLLPFNLALEMLDTFLSTPFAGGRHANRTQKLSTPIRK